MAKKDSISSFDQLTSEAFLQIDLRYWADLVENTFGEKLADPPKGVYHIGQLDPVMVDGKSYFHREDTEMVLVEDLNKISTAIYDINGEVVIPTRYMRDKARFLSNQPLLPYRGLQILKSLVDHQINSFVEYRRSHGKTVYDLLYKHLKPEAAHYVPVAGEESIEQKEAREDAISKLENNLSRWVEKCYDPVSEELRVFLAGKSWNIYFTKQYSTMLRVERCMDWRAWEWEQKHGEAFRAGKYA